MRILETYNFENQSTYGINGQIKTATLINSNKLAIANETYIEIINIDERSNSSIYYNNDEDSPAIIQTTNDNENEKVNENSNENQNLNAKKLYFATFGDIHALIFCKTGNYLLSLEKFASFGENNKPANKKSSIFFDSETESSASSSGASLSSSASGGTIGSLKVRVYTNIIKSLEQKEFHYGQEIPLIMPRIASKVTPISRCNGIEMIELDMREPPDMITCCQETGNILVKAAHNLYIFEYRECTNLHFTYVDFFEIPLVIELNFLPIQIAIVENCIAAVSKKKCCVFKINSKQSDSFNEDDDIDDECDEIDSGGISGESVTAATTIPSSQFSEKLSSKSYDNANNYDDSDTFNAQNLLKDEPFDFQFGSDFVQNLLDSKCESSWQYSKKTKSSKPGTNIFQGDSTTRIQSLEDSPIQTKDIKIKLHEISKKTYALKKILQIQMASLKENTIRISEQFTCLDIKAIYTKFNCDKEIKNNNFPVSQHFPDCIGFSFIITTTASEGYLYQFCNNDKWLRENEKPLTRYQFTAPVLTVKITDYVVHAITKETVETVTSRIGHKLFSNSLEYPNMSQPFPLETSPTVDQPIFCMKLHSFMNTHFALVNQTNIVLIAKSLALDNNSPNSTVSGQQLRMFSSIQTRLINDDVPNPDKDVENPKMNQRSYSVHCYSFETPTNLNVIEWTVYNLKMPNPINLAIDLEENATETRTNHLQQNSTTDDLIFELLTEANIILRLAKTLDLNYSPEELNKINQQFKQNCKLLAEFTVKSRNPKHYHESIGYYLMNGSSFYEIFAENTNSFTKAISNGECPEKDSFIGLIHTIEIIILNFGKKRSKAEFLFDYNPEILPLIGKLEVFRETTFDEHLFQKQTHFGFEIFKFLFFYNINLLIELSLKSMPFLDCNLQHFLRLYKNTERNSESMEATEILLKTLIFSRAKIYPLAIQELEKLQRQQLFLALKIYWNLIFDELEIINTSKNQNSIPDISSNGIEIISFSEYTENVLFHTERADLIETIADVFLYLLCITKKIQLKSLIELFVNYFSQHVMQEFQESNSNHIARKICEIILGGYFQNKFKVEFESDEKTSSSLSPQNSLSDDADSDGSNNEICLDDEGTATGSSSGGGGGKIDNKKYERMHKTIDSKLSKNNSLKSTLSEENDIENKGLILLLRLYLGNLLIATKKASNSELLTIFNVYYQDQNDINEKISELTKLRLNYIKYLSQNKAKIIRKRKTCNNRKNKEIICPPIIPDYNEIELQSKNNICNKQLNNMIANYCRPIACLEERPFFLNRMKPFGPEHFINRQFIGYNNDVLLWVLKIQCLLSSSKTQYILNDFLLFIQTNPNLIGIDSFLLILLPIEFGLELIMKLSPGTLYDYCSNYYHLPDSEYRSLLSKLMNLTSNKLTKRNYENESDDVEGDISNSDIISPTDESYQFLTQEQYKTGLDFILDRLFKDRIFESFLNCLPVDEVNIAGKHIYRETSIQQSNQKSKIIRTLVMDSVDEKNVFQLILRKGVARQRCEALLTMIESTGRQLFETSNNQQ